MRTQRVALYCFIGGLSLTAVSFGAGGFGWCWLAGIVLAAAFVPVGLFGPRSALTQFAVIAPALMMITVLCLWSEALIFVPRPEIQQHPVRNLVASAVLYLIVAAVLAALAAILKLPREDGPSVVLRSPGKLVVLVVVSGAAYALYYLVFGAITYQFFTKVYYPDAPQLVARLGVWFWPIQLARGILMTLGVLPIIRALRMSRIQSAIAVGIIVWVAGGLSPLLLPNALMGPSQRFIHVIEIFTQNALLGVTAVMLLRAQPARSSADMPRATAAVT
jgi:hypothetical protein